MIERVAAVAADGLAIARAAIEHQDRRRGAVRGEHLEHETLIVRLEVKEAVPGQDAVEPGAKREGAHVGDDPRLIRHPLATEGDQRRRGIDARHPQTRANHMRGDGRPAAAPQVQHTRPRRQRRDEAVMPGLVRPAAAAPVGLPPAGMTLVVADDQVRQVGHKSNISLPAIAKRP